jgi:hypothetical protein
MDYDYNTSRPKLVLPEYGRNIQKMVKYAMTIEDREERNRSAQAIINVMGNMNPHLRDVADFTHKLWDHLAIMSDFKLDIDSPYVKPTKQKFEQKPRPVPYNNYTIRFKHYGKAIELFIEKAIEMDDGSEKDALIQMIANHMKKAYLTWNRENVTDQQIIEDLETISKGRLKVPEDIKLLESKDILSRGHRTKKAGKKKRYNN